MLMLAVAVVGCGKAAPPPVAIKTGQDVITAMHDKYASSWFDNLTFTQRTQRRLRSGVDTIETWTETIGSPSHLRIDMGSAPSKRGVVYSADSTYLIGDGRVMRALGGGNPLLTLLHAVYKQPVAATLAQLEPLNIDMTKMRRDTWQSRPVWVIGTTDSTDHRTPQVWVDVERLVTVRMIQTAGNGDPVDVRMDHYQPIAGGWIATHVVARMHGDPVQTEDYSNLRANLSLDPRLFDPAHWSDAKLP